MKLSCIIVDDEPLALDILEDHIRRTPILELVGRFTGSADALKLLSARGGDGGRGVNLAFLDIQMQGTGGLDMAKIIGNDKLIGDTRVIFTTAFPQYALEGFRVDALDYLLKPISFAEFTRSVEKAVDWFGIKRMARGTARTLIVRSDYKQYVIPIETIVYIEGIRDYIRIHTDEGTGVVGAVQTLMNMKTVEDVLPASRFARVHRSYIVNLDRVKKIERTRIVFDGSFGDVSVPVSDTYREAFLRLLSVRAL